nr:cellulose biosynthesis cyclic di-GMP-binding regulatory protein BcsB [Caldichromatium japonicum]
MRLRFWVQPGLYVEGLQDAILRLNFSYGAGFRRDSLLNVLINGLFVRAIPLNEPSGATLLDYKLRIPAGMLRSGPNQLEILPMLVPAETGWCQLCQAENLLLTVYGDSTLELPPMTQFARLPDLELWARTGFLSLRDPEGSGLAAQVVDASPDAAGAAWTLLARLAQISGLPLYRAEIGADPDLKDRKVVVIRAFQDLDPEPKAAAPWRLSDAQSFADYGSLRTIAEAEIGGAWWQHSLARIQDWFETQIASPRDHRVRVLYADQILRSCARRRY